MKNTTHKTLYAKRYTLYAILITLSLFILPQAKAWAATTNQISQFGITWTFDRDYEYGQFANGDYWVVGPVTVIGIDPVTFTGDGGRKHQDGWVVENGRTVNGSMINPMPTDLTQGWDSSLVLGWSYLKDKNVAWKLYGDDPTTLTIPPNSSVISSISREYDNTYQTYIRVMAVLTVVAAAPDANSFRPPYVGTDKTIDYNVADLDYSHLATLTAVAGQPALVTVEGYFEKPWIDYSRYNYAGRGYHPKDAMPDYGQSISNRIQIGALMLHCNFTNAQKKTLMIRFTQLGIDLYGCAKNGREWPPEGGHGSGRKWPILFAGISLNDADMKAIGEKSGDYLYSNGYGPNNSLNENNHPPDYIDFGEDGSTFSVIADDVWGPPFSLWGLNYAPGSGVGTVSVTNGSNVVTGLDTNWITGSYTIRFGVENDDQAYSITGRTYTIASVDSPTQITLTANYTGNTASGLSYKIAQKLYYGHGTYSKNVDANEYTNSDLGLPEWGIQHSTDRREDNTWWSAPYRTENTANVWQGFLLSALIMQSGTSAKTLWNHNALFDYMDRYMEIEAALGHTGEWHRGWDPWIERMWDTYRADYGCVWIRDDPSDIYSNGHYVNCQSTFLYGDVSGDGEISAYDAALTAQAAVGLITLTPEQIKAADVSGNGEVSAYDAALIAQKAVGLIEKFPVEGG